MTTENETFISTEGQQDLTIKDKKSNRLRWIDQARGFTMFYLVITLMFPPDGWAERDTNPVFFFLFKHAGTHDTFMTVYDVGAATFIFILGFLLSFSFFKRVDKIGKNEAIKHFALRYGLLFLLGFILVAIDGRLLYKKDDYALLIVKWDVIISIATAGIVSFGFIFIRDLKIRIIAGYAWAFLYQLLMNYAGLKEYAQNSIHGGIFGSIFGYASISIIASALGEYMINEKNTEKDKKNLNFLYFGLANLIIGIVIANIPDFEAAKRQVSFAHDLIAIGATVIGMYIFILIDEKADKEHPILSAMGMNPFLIYAIAEIPTFILKETVGIDLGIGWPGNFIVLAIILGYCILISMKNYKEGKIISTVVIARNFILTLVILGGLALATGII